MIRYKLTPKFDKPTLKFDSKKQGMNSTEL